MRVYSCIQLWAAWRNRAALIAAISLSTLLALASGQARGSVFTVVFTEQGSNVVANGSGSFNLTGLTQQAAGGSSSVGINPSTAVVSVGDANGFVDDVYANNAGFGPGLIGSGSYGTGGHVTPSTGASPDFLFAPGTVLVLPHGYVSDTTFTDSSTYAGASFSSLGLTPGAYSWTWDAGANSLVVDVNTPEPASLGLLGAAAFGMLSIRRRKRLS
jgi:hypothetical protein